jgi:5-methylcytosine-specific restriction enzyme A
MRNPKWHRDEIILALDLYFDSTRGSIDKNNPRIIELSELLRRLPLFTIKPDEEKFRNTNGVTLKLANFKALDQGYSGKGMDRFSKGDSSIFDEFVNDKDKLREIANEIKKVVNNAALSAQIIKIEDDEQTKTDSVLEGQIIYKLHKVIERNTSIVLEKKKLSLVQHGYLDCEVCEFNFERFYGVLGKGFIECHHRIPLSKLKMEAKTTLNDLALVCSNCHRMLHKTIDTLTIEDLKTKLRYNRI